MTEIDSYRIISEEHEETTVAFLNKKKEVEFEFTLHSVLRQYIMDCINKDMENT